ncbi:hypothetical protein Poli38472_000098 [Pythium oligandrum]|uniref:cGMP-dependent protein kinase n=1 Tax=Pythium oligandrum TaxID=41045 RepID=A0A8K1CBS9_PYTOL|nr:hypothetical protein Poli38472_000098 [Pythium oligandrum]|eukprot:TMW60056.1 hypothetical protein Poli38472_000098 [Pythium oligandrum]
MGQAQSTDETRPSAARDAHDHVDVDARHSALHNEPSRPFHGLRKPSNDAVDGPHPPATSAVDESMHASRPSLDEAMPLPTRPKQRTSLSSLLFGSKRPSIEPDGSLPIPDVPMQRSNDSTHLRPSYVNALGRRKSTALALLELQRRTSVPSRSSGSSASSSYSAEEVEQLATMDDEMMASPSSSSSSSEDDDAVEAEEIEVNDWLDEVEEVEETLLTPSAKRHNQSFSSVSSTQSRGMGRGSSSRSSFPNASAQSFSSWLSSALGDEGDDDYDEYEPVQLTQFIKDNMPIYEVMRQVQLFRNLSQNQQEQVLRALKPAKFQDGEIIVQQGTRGSRFYMIAKGEAVVKKKIDGDDQERMITHLHPGHYFGELALIYDDPRTATVVAVGDVDLLYLTQEDFQRIGQVHLSLMLQQVPLLARLSARDQDAVLNRLRPANFNDGEYIVRQGEEGTRFYMITRGEAVVLEKDTRPDAKENEERELTHLYEGHVFGEMSLIFSEPRTASVRAVGPVKCLYLTKQDFDECLLSERFQRFIQEEYVEKATRRAMRLRVQQRTSNLTPKDLPNSGNTPATPAPGVVPPPAPSSPVRATETRKLVKQRLRNGQKVVNKYVIKGDLGKGTFGRVKLCQNEEDGKLYAVKIMHKTFVQRMAGKEDQLHDVLRREVAIMKKLNHRNVVKLVEVIDDPSSQKMYLVQEYVQHNLMDELTKTNGLDEEVARKYMRDLLCGMHYLHFHKVIHRDIKPENILVSAEGVAKIADFGTARMVMHENETLSDAKGTPAFMAPEMFDTNVTYTGPTVDVWSLGATLYMMVIGRPPWLADNEIVLSERVQQDELSFPPDVERTMDPHLKNLLQRMLAKNPKLRITLNECFTHAWITKEGSEPLGWATQEEKNLTVSVDESERAIENIPECIDLSFSRYLEQAHLLVKARLQGTSASSLPRPGSGQSWTPSSQGSVNGETRTPGSSSSASSSSPSRPPLEETSRIIRAWRHHRRVQLMYGHKELSDRSRELLLEQKRIAFSVDRAKATEIILPASNPNSVAGSSASLLSSGSTPSSRGRYPSSSAAQLQQQITQANLTDSPGRDRRMSSPSLTGSASRPSLTDNFSLSKKPSFGPEMEKELHSRTSFTSVSQLSDLSGGGGIVGGGIIGGGHGTPSIDETTTSGGSSVDLSSREGGSDADLLKRSLSRKKDFLMVTSEVFRDEVGDFQSRKILFQARDHDFSVASRVPANSNSGRDLGRSSSSQLKSLGSGKSMGSSSLHSVSSLSSSASAAKSAKDDIADIDLDGLDCVQVVDDGDDIDDEEESDRDRRKSSYHPSEAYSEDSDYSDVEADVDVDETFNDLICPSNHLDMATDDDEVAPMDVRETLLATSPSAADPITAPPIVQVYVSTKTRENLILRIRSGYAEAKGSRSYMEDKSCGIAECKLSEYDPSLSSAFSSIGFFAVYDGHNGDDTARFLQKELHHRFLRHSDFPRDPLTTIRDVCELVDEEILEKQNRSVPKRKRTEMEEEIHSINDDDFGEFDGFVEDEDDECHPRGTKAARTPSVDSIGSMGSSVAPEPRSALMPISFSGSAAVFAVVAKRHEEPDKPAPTTLYVANSGDCRAVLCTSHGLAVDLTKDHKASLDSERERIEASGGFVHNGRLDGVLALSRGFGDLAHKHEGHLIVTPDVYEHVVSPDDEFVLLASDGLFDVLTSQQAVNFVYRKLRAHGDVQLAAQEMVLKAQQYFTHDNISVVIVALNQDALVH